MHPGPGLPWKSLTHCTTLSGRASYIGSIVKSSPHDVGKGEVDQEGYLHHVAPVPVVDVLVPDDDSDCEEEEEDADAEGDGVEVGEELEVVFASGESSKQALKVSWNSPSGT